ncbi:transketolase [Paenibacillus thalictri]|nr:transketolase [Paenibacillus thalictri]
MMKDTAMIRPGGSAFDKPLDELLLNLKKNVFRMAEAAGGGYVSQGLCAAEMVAALFYRVLRLDPNHPEWPDRDRFLLSVGHYAIGVYAAMAELGFFPPEKLDTYSMDGSELEMIGSEITPGVEITGGSLGQGLSQGIGLALGAKLRNQPWRVYVLMSDGELEEGQTWEAAMVAKHHKLDQLTVIVDVNDMQADGRIGDVTGILPIAEKWQAFGWNVIEMNGNDIDSVLKALQNSAVVKDLPTVIIANTIMGNGVSFLADRTDVHYVKWSHEQTQLAIADLEAREVRHS